MNIKYHLFLLLQAYFPFVYCYLIHEAEYDLKLLSGQNTPDVIKNQEVRAAHWPLGIISFYLDAKSYDDIIAQRIYSVIDTVQSVSCVKFKPVTTKPDNITWLHITNPQKTRECVHKTWNVYDREITVVLGYECLKESDILHALLHAIGLRDEVTHPHRDRYLRVLWNNIKPEYRQLYQMQGLDSSKALTEYDPTSIMHFHDRAFSSNGHATVVPMMSGLMIAPSDHLSQLDIMKLRLLFEHECNKRKVSNVIDSCKTAFVANRDSVIPMDKELVNGERDDDENEAISDRSKDKSNQEEVNSKNKESGNQRQETESNDNGSDQSE